MADTKSIEGVESIEGGIGFIAIKDDSGADLEVQRNEHLGGEVSYFLGVSAGTELAGFKATVEQATALRDWLNQALAYDGR